MLKARLTTALAIAAGVLPAQAAAYQDLRSPDTRDAADGRLPVPSYVPSPPVAPAPSEPVADGFEWGDAGIGAAATIGLMGAAGGTVVLVSRSRRRAPTG